MQNVIETYNNNHATLYNKLGHDVLLSHFLLTDRTLSKSKGGLRCVYAVQGNGDVLVYRNVVANPY